LSDDEHEPEPPGATLNPAQSPQTAKEADSLDTCVELFHYGLSATMEVEMAAALRRYSELREGVAVSGGVGLGVDISSAVDKCLSRVWRERYGIDLTFARKALVESDPRSFKRISERDFAGVLLQDETELLGDTAKDARTSNDVSIPHLHQLVIVWPLEKPRAGAHMLQNVMALVEKHNPEELIVETPVSFAQVPKHAALSDADVLEEKLQSLHYVVIRQSISSGGSDGRPPQTRIWFYALGNVHGEHQAIATFVCSTLSGFEPPVSGTGAAWMMPALQDRITTSREYGVRSFQEMGPKPDAGDTSYKLEHCTMFRALDMEWPIAQHTGALNDGGMTPREKEVAAFLHHVFPIAGDEFVFEYVDIAPKLGRICKTSLVDEGDEKLAKTLVVGTPWTSTPPSLNGNSRLLVRHLMDDSKVTVRLVESFELLKIVGVGAPQVRAASRLTAEAEFDEHDYLMQFANKSSRVEDYLHIRVAGLITAGKFHSGEVEDFAQGFAPASQHSVATASSGTD